jgi:hypothetical protein
MQQGIIMNPKLSKDISIKPIYSHIGLYYFDLWHSGFYYQKENLINCNKFKLSIGTHMPYNAPNSLKAYVSMIQFMLSHDTLYAEKDIKEYMQLIKDLLVREGY